MPNRPISRRELLKRSGGALAAPALLRGGTAFAAEKATSLDPSGGLKLGAEIYQSIGVRPIVNARGTYTILSGSTMLPEVRAAMDAAAQRYVHLDELSEAVGARLATLTGAEWGMVSNGCSAGLTHATAACVAGGNPDLHVRIPDLRGFQKDEAIIPRHSRNVYDAAIRAVGVRVIEVSTPAELEAAIGPRTALIYILAGPNADESQLPLKTIAEIAQPKGVPTLVDAAAEILTIPNVHLKNGATLVAYSGGKCLRGPQAAGLILGRKDLVKAAWVHSAPHHGFARGFKVGKEEAIGMLMAVEMWVKRDHDAEWKRWTAWLEQIGKRVSAIDGVSTTITQPRGLSNRMPSLRVLWDRSRLNTTGDAVVRTLFEGDPRVAVFAARGEKGQTGVTVNPYMLNAGDEKVVADRLVAVLQKPPLDPEKVLAPASVDVSGSWEVKVEYAASTSRHVLQLRQSGNQVAGSHQGDFTTRDMSGTIEGASVRLRSAQGEERGDAINYTFTGDAAGEEIKGTLDMGEYLGARFTAKKRARG
jgi:L-seryl-tRNA(Ser) seleniumtransferase